MNTKLENFLSPVSISEAQLESFKTVLNPIYSSYMKATRGIEYGDTYKFNILEFAYNRDTETVLLRVEDNSNPTATIVEVLQSISRYEELKATLNSL
jgi:hypothetical protein